MKNVPKFITDLFTGPDGETWAIGRIYSLPMLVSGLAIPFTMIYQGQNIDLSALAVMFGGLGAGIMALITGTNTTEPKAFELPFKAPVAAPAPMATTVTTTTKVSADTVDSPD